MTARRIHLAARARAAVVVAAGLALGGCFKPAITDGGFVCSDTGKACPDGYTCGADHHCSLVPVTTPPIDSSMESMPMMSDASDAVSDGGGEPMCAMAAALCADGPAGSDVCSPSCQKGCACGRCNVVEGKPKCVSIGTAKLGDVCAPGANDNCAAGLICLIETCGNGLARCYRHCTSNAQCDGSACTIGIDDGTGTGTAPSYKTCDVPARACDPAAGTGCPDPALKCYLNANQTLCDCPTKQGMNNADCTIYSDCAEGFICIAGVNGQATPHCHFVCNVAAPACPKDSMGNDIACVPASTGAKFGYCNG